MLEQFCKVTEAEVLHVTKNVGNELNDYNQQTSDAQVQKYRASIVTVCDLVRFMYNHTVSRAEEYTDWEARAAACDAAKDLLGMNLSIEE